MLSVSCTNFEFFHVISGEIKIHLRDRTIELKAGECFVVPRGVEHKPEAEHEAHQRDPSEILAPDDTADGIDEVREKERGRHRVIEIEELPLQARNGAPALGGEGQRRKCLRRDQSLPSSRG